MKPTVLETQRPAAIDAGKPHQPHFARAGLRQHVTVSERLRKRFDLNSDTDHPGWPELAWAVRCTLTGILPAREQFTPQGMVRVAEYLSPPVAAGQLTNRRIAVVTENPSTLHVALPEEVPTGEKQTVVLLVEDDAQVGEMAVLMIQRLGVEVVSAADGEAGLRLAQELVTGILLATTVRRHARSGTA